MGKPHEISDALIKYSAVEPKPHCWLEDSDDGEDYCRECAEKEVSAERAKFVGGGYGSHESDGCRHCCKCGHVLDYSLTDAGARDELRHFKDYPPCSPLKKDDAYHIGRLLECDQSKSVVELAMRALALIPNDSP